MSYRTAKCACGFTAFRRYCLSFSALCGEGSVLTLVVLRQRDTTDDAFEHDLAVVAHLCDRLAVMQQGRIVETLSTEALCQGDAQHAYTRTLVAAAET